jgi:hypothetical protein
MRSMKRLGIAVTLIFVGVAVYVAMFSATLRYRLTLEAEVDGQRRTGSGVIEVTYAQNNDPISRSAFSIGVRGEAVVLDLSARGTLFALLKGDTDSRSGAEYIVLRAFNFSGGALPLPVGDGLSKVKRLSGKVELPLTSLPLLVHFRDLNDPKTVEKVDPLDIEKSFSAGTKLVRATIEIVSAGVWPFSRYGVTGEPITKGLDAKLIWLNHLDRYDSIPGNPFSTTLPPEISGLRSF